MSTAANDTQTRTLPSPGELVARARAMIPALRSRAAAGHANRRLAAESIHEMQQAGLFRVLQPRRWGGYEMSPNVYCDIIAALAEGDMSAGWVYGVVAVHAWQMGVFDDQAARDVWSADDSVLVSSSYMPTGTAIPVEGGFRFSGRWGYSSGSEHCDWVFLGGKVAHPEGDSFPPDGRTFLIPREDYEIVDTWDTSGLRATGSNDIVVNDVFVPKHRTHRGIDAFLLQKPGLKVNGGTLYRLPYGQVFIRAVSTASIGALQHFIDAVKEVAETRINVMGTRATEDPALALALAEAQNEVDELRLVLHRNFDHLWEFGERHETPPIELRTKYRFQASLPPERTLCAATRLYQAIGGAGVYNKNPFNKILADLTTGRQHAANQFAAFGRNWGGVMLGQENRDLFL
ncbi:MAG: flavin-dependent monooxygenase [Novosphingobium sp.]|nr:flavin-dependent monooxygenase [Novosphingobium sp.]